MDTIVPAVPRFGKHASKAAWMTALLGATSCFANGCGTVRNLASGDPDVYGGVHKDVKFMMTPDAMPTTDNTGGPLLFAVVAADTGLSAVADTVTLPLVIRMKQNKNGRNESRGSAAAEKGKPRADP